MRVSQITYIARESAAGRYPDGIKLGINLFRKDILVSSVRFDGLSTDLNGSFHTIEAVEADKLEVIAWDLETESHHIRIDGMEFHIPLTGDKTTAVYEYALPVEGRPLWPWALGGVAVATILGIIVARKQKQY